MLKEKKKVSTGTANERGNRGLTKKVDRVEIKRESEGEVDFGRPLRGK